VTTPNNFDDVIRDLQEDRRLECELREHKRDKAREELAARIENAFRAAGIVPVCQRTLQFEEMLAEAAEPEVEVCGLQVQAEQLVASIGRLPVYHKRKTSHEVGEVFSGDINELFRQAEEALGFRHPAQQPVAEPVVKKQSIWMRKRR
jgi:hypothetical protein